MNPLSPDNPQLTAYALGQLEDHERSAVEAALAAQPALRAQVAEIQATARRLEAALAAEPIEAPSAEELTTASRAGILSGRDPQKLDGGGRLEKIARFPQAYFLLAGLAAAGFALVVARYEPPTYVAPAKKTYVEVALPPTPAFEDSGTPSIAPLQAEVGRPPNAISPPPLTPVKFATVLVFNEDSATQESAVKPLLEASLKLGGPASVLTRSKESAITFSQGEKYAGKETISGSIVPEVKFRTAAAVTSGYIARTNLAMEAQSLRALPFGERALPLDFNTETYGYRRDNAFVAVVHEPRSTFSADIDTASYANVRRFLQAGELPPPAAVRIEELVNYFPYRYPAPSADDDLLRGQDTPSTLRQKPSAPFAASLEVAAAPWEPRHRLARIGLKGREATLAGRPAANLVFLLDVSGSMSGPNRLPLVKESLHLLLGKLRSDDRVAIVTYAGSAGLALPSTPVGQANKIREALDALTPGGSTNGAMGIQLAYDIAKANFVPGGANRVVLCTDGDFNVGVTSQAELTRLIEEKAKANVFLTVLGFGMGNLKDGTLELLADKGHGHYGYIDSRREAEKLLVEQVSGTLVAIAKDVKIQVEFNPAQVKAYRLIGYENRLLNRPDFNDDRVAAGVIGAGHTVTALYEIVPMGSEAGVEKGEESEMDELKYRKPGTGDRKQTVGIHPVSGRDDPVSTELLTVKIRYKEPMGEVSKELEFPLVDRGTGFEDASGDFRFAAAVAGFGLALRSEPAQSALLAEVARWANAGLSDDAGGHRAEFMGLVRQAQTLAR